jgi:SSS family solute:Na+ symporter
MLAGWVVGSVVGLGLCWMDGLKPVHPVNLGLVSGNVSTGLLSLGVNIAVVLAISLLWPGRVSVPAGQAVSGEAA